MIVCFCNALKEKEVRDAVRGGASSPQKAYRKLGCKFQCGQCMPLAQRIINNETATAC